MRIIINKNRNIKKENEYNTQNENKVTELTLELPQEYENWNKRIVFITDDGVFWDYIQDNTYLIKKNVTQYERVQFYIWLTNGEQDYRTETKDLFFNKNIEADDQIPTEEQIDGFNTLIATLNLEIEVVNNKETELNGIITDLQHKLDTDYFKGEKGDKGDTGDQGIQGERGEKGDQGIQGIQGERGEQGIQGDKGDKGDKGDQGIPGTNGTNGQDGISPVARVEQTSTGATISITDKNGTTSAEIRNGQDGANGTNGQDGYTPVRGTDYWTSEDIAEIEEHCDDYIDEQIANLEERVEDLENNQIQGTASGTSIDLQDSASSRVKSIGINGNSEQETTIGKNLLNPYLSNTTTHGVTVTYDENTQEITLNGTCDRDNTTVIFTKNNSLNLQSGKSLYALIKYISGSSNGYLGLRAFNSNYSKGVTIVTTEPLTDDIFTDTFYNEDVIFNYFSLRFDNGSTFDNLKIKVMFSTVDAVYEPYTNGVSPNPEYPQEVKSSGDNGYITEKIVNANLIDFSKFKITNKNTVFTFENDTITISSENGTYNSVVMDITNLVKSNKGKILSFGYEKITEIGEVVKSSQLVITDQKDKTLYYVLENHNYNIPNDTTDVKRVVFQILQNNRPQAHAGTLIIEKPILYFGEVKPTYVEHQEQIYTMPCQQPMRAIGDVKDTFVKVDGVWYERHNIKELDLKEINLRVPDSDENNIVFCNLANTSICEFKRNPQIFMSDYFKYEREIMAGGYSEALYYGVGMYSKYTSENARYLYFVIPKTIAKNLEEVNNWITENNIKIYYVAENSVDIPCTQSQITALENLQKARTYKNITHIYSEDEVSAKVDLTYYKDTQTYLDNIITRLEVLESEV